MIKKIGIGFLVLLIFFFLLAGGGLYFLDSFLTPDFLVRQIESNLNTRAEVSKVNINLFSALSSIKVEGIQLSYRDEIADSGIPLRERPPLKTSLVSIDNARLGIGLGAIFRKELNLDELTLEGLNIRLVLFESGANNLSPLFKPPVTVNGMPNPKLSPEYLELRRKEEEEAKKSREENPEPKEPFTIQKIPLSLAMREAGIQNGNISLLMKKTNQQIYLQSVNLLLKDLDVIPQDLANHNSVDLKFDFRLLVKGASGEDQAGLFLSSSGKIQPFDTNTGEVNPNLSYTVRLLKGSFITGFAVFDALAGGLPILNSLNLKSEKIAQRADLVRDVAMSLGYTKGRVTFKDSPLFPTQNYDLSILSGTWIQLTNNTHQMKGKILATKEESERVIQSFDKALQTNLKGADTTAFRNEVLGKILENGRFALPFRSSGDLKKPQVTLDLELPSIRSLLKGAATQALKDTLQKNVPKEGAEVLKKFGF